MLLAVWEGGIPGRQREVSVMAQDDFVFSVFEEELLGGWVMPSRWTGASTGWVTAPLGQSPGPGTDAVPGPGVSVFTPSRAATLTKAECPQR